MTNGGYALRKKAKTKQLNKLLKTFHIYMTVWFLAHIIQGVILVW